MGNNETTALSPNRNPLDLSQRKLVPAMALRLGRHGGGGAGASIPWAFSMVPLLLDWPHDLAEDLVDLVARPARIRHLACRARRSATDGRRPPPCPAVGFPRQPKIASTRGAVALWTPGSPLALAFGFAPFRIVSPSQKSPICAVATAVPTVQAQTNKDQVVDLSQVPQIHETTEQRDARMHWFRDAKFGMFIRWGPCTVGDREIGWGRHANRPWDINQHGLRNSDPDYDGFYLH